MYRKKNDNEQEQLRALKSQIVVEAAAEVKAENVEANEAVVGIKAVDL